VIESPSPCLEECAAGALPGGPPEAGGRLHPRARRGILLQVDLGGLPEAAWHGAGLIGSPSPCLEALAAGALAGGPPEAGGH
jgi:hypothetical protein